MHFPTLLVLSATYLQSISHAAVIQRRQATLNESISGTLDPSTEPKSWKLQSLPNTYHTVGLNGIIANTFRIVSAAWQADSRTYLKPQTFEECALNACSKLIAAKQVSPVNLGWLALNTVQEYYHANSDSRAEFEGRFYISDYQYINPLYGPRFSQVVAILDFKSIGLSEQVTELAGNASSADVTQSTPATDGGLARLSFSNNSTPGLQSVTVNVPPITVRQFKLLPNPVTGVRTRGGLFLTAMRGLCWNFNSAGPMSEAGLVKGSTHTNAKFTNARITITVLNDQTYQGPIPLAAVELALQDIWITIPDQYRGGFQTNVYIENTPGAEIPFLQVGLNYVKGETPGTYDDSTRDSTIPGLTSGDTLVINGTATSGDLQNVVQISR